MRVVMMFLFCLSLVGIGPNDFSNSDTPAAGDPRTHPTHTQKQPPWKKHLKAFETLIDTDPKAAHTELVNVSEHLFGTHELVKEWKRLYFRLSQNKKGSVSDMKRAAELVVEMLTDIDAKTHNAQIQRHQKRVKYYEKLTIEHESNGKKAEDVEVDANRFQLREVYMDDYEELQKHLDAVNALLSTNPEEALVHFRKFTEVQFGNHPHTHEWSDLVFKMHRDGKGTYPEFVRMCKLQIQMYKDVDPEKYAEHLLIFQKALDRLNEQKGLIPDPSTFEITFTMTLIAEE